MNSLRSNWLSWCTLAFLPLVWLWPSVLGGKTFVPFDPAQFPPVSLTLAQGDLAEARKDANTDVTEVWPWLLPEMQLVQSEIANGNWPSWNPHARTGAPLHEVGVHGVFYPPHWLWMFGGEPKDWLVYLTWISLALAGVFTFGLLRHVALSPLAAWFGAATFELSGTMAANGFFWTRLPTLVWLPALLWALLRLGEGERMRPGRLAAVAVAAAMPWFAGFPPYATASTLLGGLLAVCLVLARAGYAGSRAGWQLALRLGFGLLLGVLLTMPQVLPSLWFFGAEAARSADPDFQFIRATRFDTYGLLGYLMPNAFGHPVNGHNLPYAQTPLAFLWCDRGFDDNGFRIWPLYNYTEYSVFFGTLGFMLAGFGLVRGRGHMRWFIVVVMALLLGLALFMPVVNWLYHLPAIKNVSPMRWLAPGTLFLSWLAAIGLDRLRFVERRSLIRLTALTLGLAVAVSYFARLPAAWHAADNKWPCNAIAERYSVSDQVAFDVLHEGAPSGIDRFTIATERFAAAGSDAALWLLFCGALLGAYAFLRDPRTKTWILRALPLLTVIQLGLHGSTLLHGQALENATDTDVHLFLRELANAKANKDRGGFTIARAAPAEPYPTATQLPLGQLMMPGIRDLNFYSHGDARSIEPLQRLLDGEKDPTWVIPGRSYLSVILPDAQLTHPLFDLLGLRYVLSIKPPDMKAQPGWLHNAGSRVGPQLSGPGGEFFIYERPHPQPRAFTVPALRHFEDDDALLDAMVDRATRFDQAALVTGEAPAAPAPNPTDNPREVTFTRDDPSVVELDITAGDHQWLVMTDAWSPGWTATIDGEPAAIERCNHSMRLLQLPPEACHVRFEFHSPYLPSGFCLFALGIAGLAAAFVIARRSSPIGTHDEVAG